MYGWLIEIERSDGAVSRVEVYAVWEADEQRATSIVMTKTGIPGEQVRNKTPLPRSMILAFEVPQGDCRLIRPLP